MEILVTSDPVPAVVGTRASGNRFPLTLPMPYISASGWSLAIKTATSLAISSDDPPPRPITISICFVFAMSAQPSTIASGGSATTSSKRVTLNPAATSDFSTGAIRPASIRPRSVTSKARRASKRLASNTPNCFDPPHSTKMSATVVKPNGVQVILPS